MKIWFRLHGFELCSWTFVWDNLKTAFEQQGDEIYYLQDPPNPEEWVELWWGDPQFWQWSGLPVKAKIALALSEAHSILKSGRRNVIDNLNEADVIICPSEFATTAFKEAPIDVPIRVALFGIDENEYRYIDRNWNGVLNFFHGGVTQFRKGSWMVAEAFVKTFKKTEPVHLCIASPKVTTMFTQMKLEYGTHPNIEFICKMNENMGVLYAKNHVYVSPHLSEGFGLMIPEAMATGMPCIVARCSAPREFFDKKYGWWIEMSENYAPVFQCLPETNSYWRLPDINSLSECMRSVYENRDEAKEKGIEGSKFVRSSLTWGMCARNIKKIIKEVLVEKNISDNASIQRRSTTAIVFA